jgi:hypothetical protein
MATNASVYKVREIAIERQAGKWTDDGYEDGPAYNLGSSDWYEPYTSDRGRLFRDAQKEHGRCTSKVYVDGPDGRAVPIGWVFEKRQQYEDTGCYGRPAEYFTLETWVELAPEAFGSGL